MLSARNRVLVRESPIREVQELALKSARLVSDGNSRAARSPNQCRPMTFRSSERSAALPSALSTLRVRVRVRVRFRAILSPLNL